MELQIEPPRCRPATENLAAIRDHQAEICRLAGELPTFNPEHWRFARRIEELTMLTLDAIDQAVGELQEHLLARTQKNTRSFQRMRQMAALTMGPVAKSKRRREQRHPGGGSRSFALFMQWHDFCCQTRRPGTSGTKRLHRNQTTQVGPFDELFSAILNDG